jgi:hypothetical protein
MTSVQKSGPDSHVWRFIHRRPFPLNYDRLVNADRVENYISGQLRNAGIRSRRDTVSDVLSLTARELGLADAIKAQIPCEKPLLEFTGRLECTPRGQNPVSSPKYLDLQC